MARTAVRFRKPKHDHRACVDHALHGAQQTCDSKGLRLTDLRRRVLELIWNHHSPVKAYDLLAVLRKERGSAEPPTVYRALDFLVQAGLVHRLESLDAYLGCDGPDDAHSGQFLICRQCGSVAELNDASVTRVLAERSGKLGFKAEQHTIEITGLCPNCS